MGKRDATLDSNEEWLTTTQILAQYPFGRTRLYEALSQGVLRSSRWGQRYLVKRGEIERWLEEQRQMLGDA